MDLRYGLSRFASTFLADIVQGISCSSPRTTRKSDMVPRSSSQAVPSPTVLSAMHRFPQMSSQTPQGPVQSLQVRHSAIHARLYQVVVLTNFTPRCSTRQHRWPDRDMVIPTFGCPRLPHRQRVEPCCGEHDLDYRCLSIVLHEVGQSQKRKDRCGRSAGRNDGEADPRFGLEASGFQVETVEVGRVKKERWHSCERGGKRYSCRLMPKV